MPGPKWYIFNGNLNEQKDLEEYEMILSKIILNANKFIFVVGGELCSRVWNQPGIIEALGKSKAQQINFICGPMFDIKNVNLLKMAKDKKINLWLSKERQKEHYRVTDNGIFIEEDHMSFKPERNAKYCENSHIISAAYLERINNLQLNGFIEKIEIKDILSKFDIQVYDELEKENYRSPSQEEIKVVSDILME